MERKQTSQTVNTVAGAFTAVVARKMFQFHALVLGWLEVQVHMKDFLKCNITAFGERCVMIFLTMQAQVLSAICLGMEKQDGLLVIATISAVKQSRRTMLDVMDQK